MSIAAAIEDMIAEGFTLEQAIKAAKIVEANLFAPIDDRSANAKRQARFRERRAAAQTVTNRYESNASVTPADRNESNAKALQSVTFVTPLARVDSDSPESESTGKKKDSSPKALRSVTATPRQILLECLSPEIADAVLAHRKAMRRPLTGRAAQLLAKGFLATADPNAAADMMIERGWQGFKPEWFDNERRANGQGKHQGKGSIVEAGRRLTERLIAERKDRELRTGSSGGEGDNAVRFLPSQRGQRS